MSDMFAQLNEMRQRDVRQHLSEQSRIARVEMGQATFDRLKAAARPEGAPSDSGWRPAGWVPPSPLGSLLGVPVVVCGGLGPGVWRVIDRGGEVIKEGTLRP